MCVVSSANFANVNNNGNANYNNASNTNIGVRPDSLITNREGNAVRYPGNQSGINEKAERNLLR